MNNFDLRKFLSENKLTADSKNLNEVNLYNLSDLPSDVEWKEGGIDDMGTDNPLDAEPSEREGYDVQVFGYSPSTDKSYEGLAAGSYGETDFNTIDNIEEIPNKSNPYHPSSKVLGEIFSNTTPDYLAYDVAEMYANNIIPGSELFTYGPDEEGTYELEFQLGFETLDGISPEEKEADLNNEIGSSGDAAPGSQYTRTRVAYQGEQDGEHVFLVHQRGGYNI